MTPLQSQNPESVPCPTRPVKKKLFEAYLRKQGSSTRPHASNSFVRSSRFTIISPPRRLIERLRAEGIPASKATVYRTLAVMLACGILVMHDFGEGARYYEHTYGHAHHDHFFCVGCKAIKEFRDERIESPPGRGGPKDGRRTSRALAQALRTLRNVPQRSERSRTRPQRNHLPRLTP
jgi:Fur family ferric uptake transcriptional regulator